MKKSVIILGTAFVLFANVSVASNHKPLVKDQIEFSAYESSPLHIAVCNGDLESVKKSIEYGADVNKLSRDMSPLMLAARFNRVEIIKVLLENGAKPSLENDKGLKALDYAKYSKATESIAILKGL
ncbi:MULTISPECIES: ankyrin repeat domain-containing protein [Flavobacterium]|jgi:ankyrin repeat protein|uniref:Ankyrin repeat domain-containing protein n=1 Tax=Flavobacterium cupriresistens TaxID=2893885 RepID=A0ABU4RB11_9FLAO|nr:MULTISPECIES: ankyrin repeat domain-containing protein [unclassified Flavobacterium]KLT69789.1 ankyrin [Flavobacterium sp. ABG]MDX6189446.1 ankyrin repeat domain-containing protein [Flavobacterium sp. Fl-318]UFH41144.1 ankyrin repeat domain-containing protein [Flavobacterium sp. F-323]